MKRGDRGSRWTSALALPLTLWSAVPGVQWCPLGWAEVTPALVIACVSPAPLMDAGSTGCCERSCREPAPDDHYPGGRAYCLGGPSGGDGLAPGTLEARDASGPAAVLPPETDIAHRARVACPVVAALVRPPPSPIGAVPRTRAPPRVG